MKVLTFRKKSSKLPFTSVGVREIFLIFAVNRESGAAFSAYSGTVLAAVVGFKKP